MFTSLLCLTYIYNIIWQYIATDSHLERLKNIMYNYTYFTYPGGSSTNLLFLPGNRLSPQVPVTGPYWAQMPFGSESSDLQRIWRAESHNALPTMISREDALGYYDIYIYIIHIIHNIHIIYIYTYLDKLWPPHWKWWWIDGGIIPKWPQVSG